MRLLTGKKVVCCETDKDNSGLNKSMCSSGVRMGGLLQKWARGREKTYKIYYSNKWINGESTKKTNQKKKKNTISGRKDVYVNPSNANITLKVAGMLQQEEKAKNKQHKIRLSFKNLVKLIKNKVVKTWQLWKFILLNILASLFLMFSSNEHNEIITIILNTPLIFILKVFSEIIFYN